MGIQAPSDIDVETTERLNDIRPQLRKHVEAGALGHRANVPGSARRVRDPAAHHSFGAGPGEWCAGGAGSAVAGLGAEDNDTVSMADTTASDPIAEI